MMFAHEHRKFGTKYVNNGQHVLERHVRYAHEQRSVDVHHSVLVQVLVVEYETYQSGHQHRLDEPDFGEGWFLFDTEPRPPEDRRKLFQPRRFVRRRDVLQTGRAPTVHRAFASGEQLFLVFDHFTLVV